jgi:hypothetical protein
MGHWAKAKVVFRPDEFRMPARFLLRISIVGQMDLVRP